MINTQEDATNNQFTEHKSLLLVPFRTVYYAYHAVFPVSCANTFQVVNKICLSKETRKAFLQDLNKIFCIPDIIPDIIRTPIGQNKCSEKSDTEQNISVESQGHDSREISETSFLVEMIGKSKDIREYLIDTLGALDDTGMVRLNDFRSILSTIGVQAREKDIEDVASACDAMHEEYVNYSALFGYCVEEYKNIEKAKAFNVKKTGAAIKIQRMLRVVLRKRKYAKYLKQTAAAILLQAQIRRFLAECRHSIRLKKAGKRFDIKWKHRRKHDSKVATLENIISTFVKYWVIQNEENLENCRKFFRMVLFPEWDGDVAKYPLPQDANKKETNIAKTRAGGFKPPIKAPDNNKDEKIDDNSENIEDARIDFDLFAKMVRHCSRNLMPYSEMLRIYNDVCCISKDTGFGLNEWVQVCLHFGIYVPVDSKTGNIMPMDTRSTEEV